LSLVEGINPVPAPISPSTVFSTYERDELGPDYFSCLLPYECSGSLSHSVQGEKIIH